MNNEFAFDFHLDESGFWYRFNERGWSVAWAGNSATLRFSERNGFVRVRRLGPFVFRRLYAYGEEP